MKLEETENLKVRYVGNIQTKTSQFSSIKDSDNELPEKITQILNIYEKNQTSKVNRLLKNDRSIVVDMDISLLNADKNNRVNKINHKTLRKNKYFYQYMKKIKIYQTKTFQVTTAQENRTQSSYQNNFRGRSPERRNSQNSSLNRYRIYIQNSQYRKKLF